jgi:citrate lyase beta subunit
MIRSFHFIPVNNERFILKAISLNADAFIFDLEDAVAESEKSNARKLVAKHISSFRQVFIRINPEGTSHFRQDIDLVKKISASLQGIVLPKADVKGINSLVKQLGNNLEILPLIEKFNDLISLNSILSSPQIKFASLGLEDLLCNIPYDNSNLEKLEQTLKSNFCISCFANGVAPIDIISTKTSNENELFKIECQTARKNGFLGKLSIHPNQIESINQTFKPNDEELRWAKDILNHDSNEKTGYKMHKDGVLTTPPKVKKAKNIIKYG